MSRKRLKVCYAGSGVHSLRGWATFFIVYSIIGLLITIVGVVNNSDSSYSYGNDSSGDYALIVFGISAILTGCIFAPILRGIATIAETALVKKHIIMLDFKIIESDQSGVDTDHKFAEYEKERIDDLNKIRSQKDS